MSPATSLHGSLPSQKTRQGVTALANSSHGVNNRPFSRTAPNASGSEVLATPRRWVPKRKEVQRRTKERKAASNAYRRPSSRQDALQQSSLPLADVAVEACNHASTSTQEAWAAYERALVESPLKTKALTSFVGLALADTIAQTFEGGCWDCARTAKLASFGLLWHGISAHVWYEFLDTTVMPERPKSSTAIMTKMLLDQAIWAPINTALFFAYIALMDGKIGTLPSVLQAKLVPTVLAGYALWPIAHIINFKFIPSNQRLLYINVVNLFWTVYLSQMANAPILDPNGQSIVSHGIAIPVSTSSQTQPSVVNI